MKDINTKLDLTNAKKEDFSFLANKSNIEELILDGSNINDNSIEVIRTLTQLRKLSITDTTISNLSFLEPLKNITDIDISGSKVLDITPFSHLKELQCITAHDTKINNLRPLSQLKKLTELSMERSNVSNLEPLGKVKSLEIIDLYGCKHVEDIKPLGKLEHLKELSVKGTKITEPDHLNCLENLKKLQKLQVNNDIEFAANAILNNSKDSSCPASFFSPS